MNARDIIDCVLLYLCVIGVANDEFVRLMGIKLECCDFDEIETNSFSGCVVATVDSLFKYFRDVSRDRHMPTASSLRSKEFAAVE